MAGQHGSTGDGSSPSPSSSDDHAERQRKQAARADCEAFAEDAEKQCGPRQDRFPVGAVLCTGSTSEDLPQADRTQRRGPGDAACARRCGCHASGLVGGEPLSKIRKIAHEWKQPFQQEYTERTVNQAFENLLGLRSDVEQALAKAASSTQNASKKGPLEALKPSLPAKKAAPGLKDSSSKTKSKDASRALGTAEVEPGAGLDFETCMEQIWEQLIATPPSRGRSMTTVKLGGTRILLSSWEVTAFVSEDGPSAEDLRRAVVARALVTAATESAKESGNATSLDRAMNIARVEVTRLQERVDMAKRAKDTEAAVNLGISTKRLLSTLDEAEKL